MKQLEVTEEEEELILAIRNLIKAYPNGYKELLWFTQQLFDELVDLPKDN